MVLVALFALRLSTATVAPVPLASFDTLLDALRAEAPVRAVGGMDVGTFEYSGAGAVGDVHADRMNGRMSLGAEVTS